MRRADILASLFLIGAGLLSIFWLIPAQTTRGGAFGLPPAFVPTVIMSLLTILSVLLLGRSLLMPRREDDAPPISRHDAAIFAKVAGLMFGCMLVVHVVGVTLGGAITIAAFMLFMGERRPLPILLTAGGTAAAVHVFFVYGFGIPL